MFTRKLWNDPGGEKATQVLDPATPNYRMADFGYGKKAVRLFFLRRNGPVHTIAEYWVSSQMRLRTHKEYYNAENVDVVGSDVQETNIYRHAKRFGLTTPEEYALTLTEYFLNEYPTVAESNVTVDCEGWERLGLNGQLGYEPSNPHNHVFARNSNGRRFCDVVRKRGETKPQLIAGIAGLRLCKTAKSSFVGYAKGTLFTEGDRPDRILCLDVNAKWQYAKTDGIDFEDYWQNVRNTIVHTFAGDAVKGTAVFSVQNLSYTTEKAVLDAYPEICSISINFPNYICEPFDFSKFPPFEPMAEDIVCITREVPSAIGYAQLDRIESVTNADSVHK